MHDLSAVSSARQDGQTELTDLAGTKSSLECIIEDLQASAARTTGQKEELQDELSNVRRKIAEKEEALVSVLPQWQAQRDAEAAEKRKLDESNARLEGLFSKRGRVTKFRTKTERDKFLNNEIQSISTYLQSQNSALQSTRAELDTVRRSEREIEEKIQQTQETIESGRSKVTELADEITKLKEEQGVLSEQRKEMWREDAKLESLVARANDEMKNAERLLSGMMDKVWCS
jgi:structural maintenance of chromosome 3 (chondroitin sulfate proteoglycan 6)